MRLEAISKPQMVFDGKARADKNWKMFRCKTSEVLRKEAYLTVRRR